MAFLPGGSVSVIILSALIYQAGKRYLLRLPPVFDGYCHPSFSKVADIFREQIENGKEPGGTYAVYLNGELMVDLWGGYADVESAIPWRNYTMTNAASVTKGIGAIAIAKLVDQGHLSYDRLVSDYWPEFAQGGKENITVRMLLSHQAGLVNMQPGLTVAQERNLHEHTDLLIRQKPLWPPGTAHGYHMLTFGMYASPLFKKAHPKHKGVEQYFAEEIADPFDIDLYIGAPKELQYRVARNYRPDPLSWQFLASIGNSKLRKAYTSFATNEKFRNSFKVAASYSTRQRNDPEILEIPCLSANAYGTARAVAKLFGILANGGRHGDKQLLGSKTINALRTPVVRGMDKILYSEQAYSMGMWIMKNPEGGDVFGHVGYGGQTAYADDKNKLAVAYMSNHFSPYAMGEDPRFTPLEKATYDCLRQL